LRSVFGLQANSLHFGLNLLQQVLVQRKFLFRHLDVGLHFTLGLNLVLQFNPILGVFQLGQLFLLELLRLEILNVLLENTGLSLNVFTVELFPRFLLFHLLEQILLRLVAEHFQLLLFGGFLEFLLFLLFQPLLVLPYQVTLLLLLLLLGLF